MIADPPNEAIPLNWKKSIILDEPVYDTVCTKKV